ncbi:hypothetical protein [uncultured Cohaesibacter sp.]|uniref:hypothetical protein n=1 Tax=uncultured Cohaesibacter sp. TaxID=1002546 RepID=UPI00292E80C2|nr:hypothetical protein [uncultured Cohaesibacter sp.]
MSVFHKCFLAVSALMLTASVALSGGVASENKITLQNGYVLDTENNSVKITQYGKSVFQAGRPEVGNFVTSVNGPRDMTGNGIPDISVMWMLGRSSSAFVILEFGSSGLKTLYEVKGAPWQMNHLKSLSNEETLALINGTAEVPLPGNMMPIKKPLLMHQGQSGGSNRQPFPKLK